MWGLLGCFPNLKISFKNAAVGDKLEEKLGEGQDLGSLGDWGTWWRGG